MRWSALLLLCTLCASYAQREEMATEEVQGSSDTTKALAQLVMAFNNAPVNLKPSSHPISRAPSAQMVTSRPRGRMCQLTKAKANRRARTISFSHKRGHKIQYVNLAWHKFWWDKGQCWVRMKVSSRALRTIRKLGIGKAALKFGVDLKQYKMKKQPWYGEYKPKPPKVDWLLEIYKQTAEGLAETTAAEMEEEEEEDDEDLPVMDEEDGELGVVDDDDDLGVVADDEELGVVDDEEPMGVIDDEDDPEDEDPPDLDAVVEGKFKR